jgi:hypothetical protein
MPWIAGVAAAGASAVGSIASGVIGSNASASAAKEQQQSQQNTLNWIQQVYGNTQTNLSPFINTGQQALSSLSGFYGLPGGNASGASQAYSQYQNTPFYQFPLQQQTLATNRTLASAGLSNSGAALRDISQLNAGYASQGLGQYLSGLTGLAGTGQSAAGQLASAGSGTYSGIGAANQAFGNAGAAGTVGGANALTSSISGVGGALSNPNTISALQTAFGGSSSSYGPANGSAPGSLAGGGTGIVPGGQGGGSLYGNGP